MLRLDIERVPYLVSEKLKFWGFIKKDGVGALKENIRGTKVCQAFSKEAVSTVNRQTKTKKGFSDYLKTPFDLGIILNYYGLLLKFR